MPFRVRSFRILVPLAIAACTTREDARPDSTAAAPIVSASPNARAVPAWIQPIFRELDTLLTDGQRDTLRRLTLDSAFAYRVRVLGPILAPQTGAWIRTPAGDTIIARGEKSNHGAVLVMLDLYQQHLRGEALDVAGALHRYSPDYAFLWGRKIAFDSLLIARDIDGDGRTDRVGIEKRTGDTPKEKGGIVELRVSLFLDTSTAPTWASHWMHDMESTIRGVVSLGAGLVQVDLSEEESEETIFLHARDGAARAALRHRIDGGDGMIRIAAAGGRVQVTATKGAEIEGKQVAPAESCGADAWPALVAAFDSTTRRFTPAGSTCVNKPR